MLNRTLALAALLIAVPVLANPARTPDRFQFKSLCEMQKTMPGGQKVNCHCGERVFDRYVRKQLDRMDETIRYYEEKRDEGTEKSESYERTAKQYRERRAKFVDDCLRMDTEVFREIMRQIARECPDAQSRR